MAALVWPNIVRFSIIQAYAGREVVNLWDMHLDPDPGTTREEACFGKAGDILNNWDDHIRTAQVVELLCVSVDWVDMNSEEGSTGSRSTTDTNVWPAAGGSVTSGLPSNVAGLITKVAPGGGRATRNGRLYLCGLSEGVTSTAAPSDIAPASVASINVRWAEFLEGVDDEGFGGIGSSGVLRTRNIADEGNPPNVIAVGFDEITELRTESRLATQRRRLRG